MLASAGASISSMPSSEIYTAMQTGVLDATNTSNDSFVSYRIYEQVKCLTAPGENAIWFMYEPVIMPKKAFDRLKSDNPNSLISAQNTAEDYFTCESRNGEKKLFELGRASCMVMLCPCV